MVRQVQPLRISKHSHSHSYTPTTPTPSSSPGKMASPRPLAEIANTSQRRNSPSYNQATRKMIVSRESSPFAETKSTTEQSSPFSEKTSPRPFWSAHETMSHIRFDENTPDRSPSPSLSSPKRRSSIEKLKQASRVKNSNIFALESKDAYDPSSLPIVERPSANRPLSQQFVNNSFTRFDSQRKENNPLQEHSPRRPGHKRSETEIHFPLVSPTKFAATLPLPDSPEKPLFTSPEKSHVASPEKPYVTSPSPTKSSIARTSMFGLSPQTSFDPDAGLWSDDEHRASTPRPTLHRHNKSVTFNSEPPAINEYEQQTPEPSVSVGSREGSWDSDEYEDGDMSFDRGSSADVHDSRDDSFDEDLENTDKTPVVLPEDWTRMSPNEARRDLVNDEDDVFDGSPSPRRGSHSPYRPTLGRSESVTSDGESRPLPPLPAFMRKTERPDSSASSAGTEHGAPEEMMITNLDTGEKVDVQVRVAEAAVDNAEDEENRDIAEELAEFDTAPAPRISRESILRKVRGTKYDFEDEDDEDEESVYEDSPARPTYEEMAMMDPDEPIPSRENSRETSDNYLTRHAILEPELEQQEEEIEIKAEPMDDDDGIDMNAIPAIGDEDHSMLLPPRSPSRLGGDEYDRQSSVLHHDIRGSSSAEEDDDDGSHYSSLEPEAESTVIHSHDAHGGQEEAQDYGKETLDDAMQLLSVKDYSEAIMAPPAEPAKKSGGGARSSFMGLPKYLGSGEYDFGMGQYITPSPPVSNENTKQLYMAPAPVLEPAAEFRAPLEEVHSPYSGAEVSPPGTPDSVIQHSRTSDVSSLHVEEELQYAAATQWQPEPEPEAAPPEVLVEAPVIPERRSTIKTGGRLKARPSATPADFEAMAVQRRMISSEYPIPPKPSPYRSETGSAIEAGALEAEDGSVYSSEGAESAKADSLVDQEQQQQPAAKRRESRRMRMIDIPQLDASHAGELSLGLDKEFDRVIESQKVGNTPPPYPPPVCARFDTASQSSAIYPYSSAEASITTPYSPHTRNAGLGADISTRSQKGYLMRQNTKVVVASNRNFSGDSDGTASSKASNGSTAFSAEPATAGRPSPARQARSANSSPRKPSAEQFLRTEPWNGTSRRKSVRNASAQKPAYGREAAAPLPGQESALGVVDEDFAAGTSSLEDEVGEGVERGRLFVKVVGVKDLELPMPRNDRIYFQLTLDNGLHCVTTTSLELGKNAPIGQEFELVVLNDLEFQLTLTTKLPPPQPAAAPATPVPSSPTKSSIKSQKAPSGFARFLTSPKKRAERERQEREAAEAAEGEARRVQEEAQRRHRALRQPPTAWSLLHELVNAADGSFARAYINLKTHEKSCFGRPLTVDVPCYNEWAQENDTQVVNSVRSKRGAHNHHQAGPIRRPPYVVGKLELQLLYVPKPAGPGEGAMPKSMGSAVREMGKASEVKQEVVHEGHLSQQGGDCQHWRRRFFRLQGPRLTAYHEQTHQKRAVINLTKASRLVDDKSTLVSDPTSGNPAGNSSNGASTSNKGKAGGRRKSAFAEEDEGYQYVEEGFRIRFANGETIDFYADSAAQKEGWMEVLSQVVGKADAGGKNAGGGASASWTDLVLAREKAAAGTGDVAAAGAGASASPDDYAPSSSSSSPMKQQGVTEVKDFTRPAAAPAAGVPMQQRRQSDRKPIVPPVRQASKSAPTSPIKSAGGGGGGGPPSQRAPPPPSTNTVSAAAAARARAQTPPLAARRAHRARDAVKSMIF
ncbi:hypothetical protein LTR36_008107 [Oleoguttula mirabilis]|uniref:PH domain-containing protein n=1 Tax=Oleoguttula mirabilis TaxID=1507867 RepID=A0AAV9J8E3_9PEZI|nr:hypothetical protein LTR36_008107 [Oleoguttula mirabilis]